MITIVILCLVILAGFISLSQYFTFKQECDDEKTRFGYKVFSVALACTTVTATLMYLTYGETVSFIVYSLDKFIKVLVMGEIVMLTQDMVDVNKKYISTFLSIITYGAVMLFFIDTFAQGGRLAYSPMGVYFSPVAPWHKALYFVYYMSYVVMLLVFIVYRGITVVKQCEKHDLLLLSLVYSCSSLGFLAELFIINYGMVYFPFAIFGNLLAVILMRKLLKYHKSISIEPEVFEKELDPGRTDICFILNDQFTVIYVNKRAEIFAQIVEDTYVGRRINDIFEFGESGFSQLEDTPDEIPFGVSADYPRNKHHVNMIVQHRLDSYGERLATVVFIYNIEDVECVTEIVSTEVSEDDSQMIERAKSITKGARALIVDEDVIFLNVLSRLLQQYEVTVKRAVSGVEALEEMENNVYDIVFITYEMGRMNGNDTVRKIRKMSGDYYQQVPIVFISGADINEVFNDFIEAGFNDFLEKPLSKRSLNSVLTRWLWQRFNALTTTEAQIEEQIKPQYLELSNLLEDALAMYQSKDYEKLSYVINGIKRTGMILGMSDLADLASGMDEAIMFEDTERIDQLFERIEKGIRHSLTINA